MTTTTKAFDFHLETWKREQQTPWQQVRRKVEISNLLRHIDPSGLKVLDAGGGNGLPAIPLAQNGCRVLVADASEAMIADGRQLMAELGLDEWVGFVLTRLEDLSTVIQGQWFDVVLCHNVLENVECIALLPRTSWAEPWLFEGSSALSAWALTSRSAAKPASGQVDNVATGSIVQGSRSATPLPQPRPP